MPECYKRPQCIEHHTRAHQTEDVQFSEVFHCRYSMLVRVVYILLQPPTNVFEDLIYNGYGESRMIALQVVCQHSQQIDIAVFDFPRFRENFVQRVLYKGIIPI